MTSFVIYHFSELRQNGIYLFPQNRMKKFKDGDDYQGSQRKRNNDGNTKKETHTVCNLQIKR